MMNPESRERTLADYARVALTLPGAQLPWLVRERQEALERFAQSGYPTTRDEEWKYTNVSRIERQAFLAIAETAAEIDAASALLGTLAPERETGHWLVFVNGRHAPSLSSLRPLPAGVELGSLAQALQQMPEMLEPYLSDRTAQTVFGGLNTAFMADGAWLHVPQDTLIEEPIHLLFLATQNGAAVYPRNVLVAEPGARATVIEHYAGLDDVVYLTNAVTQIFTARGAVLEHYKLQQESAQAFHVAGVHAQQQQDSRLESHSISLGALLARNDITTAFGAPGCEVTLNGLYLVGGRQHVDNHTRVEHAAPHGTSHEYYRGGMDGTSRAVFNGKVIVHAGAQKTNAHQANHNLLLSRDAEVDTKPQLEIYADDVQCTHGATVGQIDDEQLFYLQSRGIEAGMAQSLLVHAFAHDVIERIRVESLRRRLEKILFTRLPQGERIRELA
jgi:Fe-S cluster assembly protein SufD